MPHEPTVKRAVTFIDGQNLFYAAKEAFGYSFPNYDAKLLSETVCRHCSCTLVQSRFYTGIPDAADDAAKSHFWSRKLAVMGRQGIKVFSRPLRYRNRKVTFPMVPRTRSWQGKKRELTSASLSTSFASPSATNTTSP